MGMIMVRYPTKRDKRRQPFQPKCVCLVLNIKFYELTKKVYNNIMHYQGKLLIRYLEQFHLITIREGIRG